MATFLDLNDYLLVSILLELDVDVAEVLNARKVGSPASRYCLFSFTTVRIR